MLDGATRQEVETIVNDRIRSTELSQSHLRMSYSSIKRDLADLDTQLRHLRDDQTLRFQALTSDLHDARTGIRGLALDLEAHRNETAVDIARMFARFERIDERFEEVDDRLAGVDARFDGVDARFDGVDARFDGVDARFDGVDARFDGVDARFDGVDARLEGIERSVGEIRDLLVGGSPPTTS